MNLFVTPVAEASITTLIKSVNRVLVNPFIYLLFALALMYFIYGLLKYLMNPDDQTIRKESKSQMLNGIIGLFIMVAVFGIMNLILGTIGEDRIDINETGDYTVQER